MNIYHKMTILSNLNAQIPAFIFLMLEIQYLLLTNTMMVLFKYVTHTGIMEIQHSGSYGTTSLQQVGQMLQLKWCADNWVFHIQVGVYKHKSFCALSWTVGLELLVGTDARAFSVSLSKEEYRVRGLRECNECDRYLSQCLTQWSRWNGWSRAESRDVAALNCCKTIV